MSVEMLPEKASGVAPVRAAMVFIFITIVLDVLALGLIIPVLPRLVLGFVGENAMRAAELYGLFGTVFAAMQFLFSPFLGVLSDRFGRRPVVLISNFGLGLDYILMAFAPSLSWLFAGRVISGICSASISAASAYIADVTPPEKRAAGYGMLGAAFGLGFVVGPALGGYLGSFDARLPFWVAAGLSLANAAYGFFVLPESLATENRSPFRWKRANPLGAFEFLSRHRDLFGMAGVVFLINLAHVVFPATFVLFAQYRFGWTEKSVGLVLGAAGLCTAIVQGGLVRRFIHAFGERRCLIIGNVCGVLGFALYGLAPTGALFCAAIPVMSFWGLAGPSIQALMTRHLQSGEQGQLQGALTSLAGVASVIGPLVFNGIFAVFIGSLAGWHVPGAPFLLAALITLVSIPLALRFSKGSAAGEGHTA